jgi:tetratricopeptide (TPR) repeat protein
MKKTTICGALCVAVLFSICLHAYDASLDQADALYRQGDFFGAIKIYREILRRNPQSEKAHLGLVRSLWKEDEVQAAHEAAETALASFPGNAPLNAAMGDVLFRMARIGEAQKAYAKAVGLNPNCARAYYGLAQIHELDFNRKSTKRLIEKAYECDPEDPEIVYGYAGYAETASERAAFLERYLQLATNEREDKRIAVANQIEYFKKAGDLKTWRLKKPPQTAEIPLQSILPYPNRPITGYHIKARINNKKDVSLQLDTGAGGVLIHPNIAKKLKLEILSANRVRGIGNAGPRQGYLALAPSVRIGPFEFADCLFTVTEKNLLRDTDGIIGTNLFNRYLITLDLPERKLKLRPLPSIDGKPYDDPESWVELDRTKLPELASYSAMGRRGALLIPTLVNDKKLGYLFLDTGAADNLLSRDFAEDIADLREVGNVIQGISGSMEAFVAEDVTIKIGHFIQKQKHTYAVNMKGMSRHLGFEISGLLGHSLLKMLSITIDYRDGLINFEYPGEKGR